MKYEEERYYLTSDQNIAFLKSKVSKLYNCLCLFEESDKNVHKAIASIINELEGRAMRCKCLNNNTKYQAVIDTLNFLHPLFQDINPLNQPTVKSELFKCLNYLNQVSDSFKLCKSCEGE